MNSLIRPIDIKRLLRAGAAAIPASIVLGMPHLCLGGLSETWLLKECGHRHWVLLAEAAGLDRPEFHDAAGEPIYAAFLAFSVRDGAFETVREHNELAISSDLTRTSRSRFTSIHRLSVRARTIGEVAMTSTFVRRAQKGRNHTIARAEVSGLPPVGAAPHVMEFITESVNLRSNRWDAHLGFKRDAATVIDRFEFDPCPAQDFNGADFLYFASFQAFVDRAEWSFFRPDGPFPATRRRDIIYRRNIDPGERVIANLLQFWRNDEILSHWYCLQRAQDNLPIADIFTVRSLSIGR